MTTTHKLINQLIQLQELVVANMQKKVSMPKARLEELEKSIMALGSDLPQQVKSHFNRLLAKHPEAIVPVSSGTCAGCGMALTKSLVQSVHKAEQMNRCPNCARFLYYPEQLIERERTSRVYGEARKTGIGRFTSPELMMVSLKGSTPEEVLGEMCARMAKEGFVGDGEHLLEYSIVSGLLTNTLKFFRTSFKARIIPSEVIENLRLSVFANSVRTCVLMCESGISATVRAFLFFSGSVSV